MAIFVGDVRAATIDYGAGGHPLSLAELVEIFQWLTPEQSQQLGEAERVHLGEEIAA